MVELSRAIYQLNRATGATETIPTKSNPTRSFDMNLNPPVFTAPRSELVFEAQLKIQNERATKNEPSQATESTQAIKTSKKSKKARGAKRAKCLAYLRKIVDFFKRKDGGSVASLARLSQIGEACRKFEGLTAAQEAEFLSTMRDYGYSLNTRSAVSDFDLLTSPSASHQLHHARYAAAKKAKVGRGAYSETQTGPQSITINKINVAGLYFKDDGALYKGLREHAPIPSLTIERKPISRAFLDTKAELSIPSPYVVERKPFAKSPRKSQKDHSESPIVAEGKLNKRASGVTVAPSGANEGLVGSKLTSTSNSSLPFSDSDVFVHTAQTHIPIAEVEEAKSPWSLIDIEHPEMAEWRLVVVDRTSPSVSQAGKKAEWEAEKKEKKSADEVEDEKSVTGAKVEESEAVKVPKVAEIPQIVKTLEVAERCNAAVESEEVVAGTDAEVTDEVELIAAEVVTEQVVTKAAVEVVAAEAGPGEEMEVKLEPKVTETKKISPRRIPGSIKDFVYVTEEAVDLAEKRLVDAKRVSKDDSAEVWTSTRPPPAKAKVFTSAIGTDEEAHEPEQSRALVSINQVINRGRKMVKYINKVAAEEEAKLKARMVKPISNRFEEVFNDDDEPAEQVPKVALKKVVVTAKLAEEDNEASKVVLKKTKVNEKATESDGRIIVDLKKTKAVKKQVAKAEAAPKVVLRKTKVAKKAQRKGDDICIPNLKRLVHFTKSRKCLTRKRYGGKLEDARSTVKGRGWDYNLNHAAFNFPQFKQAPSELSFTIKQLNSLALHADTYDNQAMVNLKRRCEEMSATLKRIMKRSNTENPEEKAECIDLFVDCCRDTFKDIETGIAEVKRVNLQKIVTRQFLMGEEIEELYENWMEFGEQFLTFEKTCREAKYEVGLSYFMERKFAFQLRSEGLKSLLDSMSTKVKKMVNHTDSFVKQYFEDAKAPQKVIDDLFRTYMSFVNKLLKSYYREKTGAEIHSMCGADVSFGAYNIDYDSVMDKETRLFEDRLQHGIDVLSCFEELFHRDFDVIVKRRKSIRDKQVAIELKIVADQKAAEKKAEEEREAAAEAAAEKEAAEKEVAEKEAAEKAVAKSAGQNKASAISADAERAEKLRLVKIAIKAKNAATARGVEKAKTAEVAEATSSAVSAATEGADTTIRFVVV